MKKRNIYLFAFLGIFVVIAIGVFYALAPGVVPNPGHDINELSVPSGCVSWQFLQWDGTGWACSDICPSGTHVMVVGYNNGVEDIYGSRVSISCETTLPTDTCDGNQTAWYECSISESKTCLDVAKLPILCPPLSQCLGGWTCGTKEITCEKAAMLCGE